MKIIDCDSHFITPDIFDHIPSKFQKDLPNIIFNEAGGVDQVTFAVDPINHQSINRSPEIFAKLPGGTNMVERFKDLKKMKVDFQLLCPQERVMRFSYAVEKNLGAAMAHSYNITLKKIVDQYPDTFIGVPLVPLQDLDLALRELDWIIQNKFKIVYLHLSSYDQDSKSNVLWSNIDQMNSFYKICEKNNIIIMLHGLMQDTYKVDMPDNIKLIANSNQLPLSQLVVYDLLLDNIFDRYPTLQIILAETANKNMHTILNNLKNAYNTNPELFKGKKYFLDYLKKNIFFAIDIEMKEGFNALMENIGSERLLFSTDYPHDDIAGINKWKDVDDLHLSGLKQIDLENIAFRNAEKLFNIKLSN